MEKMSIWFLSAHDQPKGLSSRTYDFAKELVKQGHQVTMFTNSYCHWKHTDFLEQHEKSRIEEIEGIRVVWLKTTPYKGNGWARGVNMLFNIFRSIQVAKKLQDKPDVVIGPSVPPGTAWAAAYIAKLKGAAFVFEIRDVWPIRLVYDGNLSKLSPVYHLFRVLEKYLYRKAHAISTALPFVHDHVSQSGGDTTRITWIPNGINLERFKGFDSYEGGKDACITAMYIGGLGVKHGVSTIIKAAGILAKKSNNPYRFIIVGDGPNKHEYQREAATHDLLNMEFRDGIPKSEIPKIQAEADVLIVSVLNSEAYRFGINFNKLFDYLASARPVILACNAPNDPVVESGAGLSVPPENPEAMAEALEKFLKMSPDERMNMGRLGRHYVEKVFDIQKITAHMENLLLGAIKAKESMRGA